MGTQEFSDQFDVLYNNITSNQAPGLNEYEKSVFLTKAQEEIVKNYFSPKANPKGDGFDDSPKRQADFSTLIRVGTMQPTTSIQFDRRTTTKVFNYPNADIFLVLNEQVRDSVYDYVVRPISYEEYDRLMSKPYKYPPKYQAWRLITEVTTNTGSNTVITPDTKRLLLERPEDPTTEDPGGVANYILSFTTVYNSTNSTTITLDYDDSRSTKYTSSVTGSDNKTITLTLGNAITFGELKNNLRNDVSISGLVSVEGDGSDSELDFTSFCGEDYGESITLTPTSEVVTVTRGTPTVELIGRFYSGLTYTVRYVKKPYPIVLADFTNTGVSIDGVRTPRIPVCELPEQLHEEILQRAVELAKVAWTNNGQDNVALAIEAGKSSE